MLRNLKFDAVMQLAGTEDIAVVLFIGMAGGPATVPSVVAEVPRQTITVAATKTKMTSAGRLAALKWLFLNY
ncbi:MAG: hypothetical protein J1D86_06860 [Alistipes sp.]|nr:hypothetical protein [Alistipes sp.]